MLNSSLPLVIAEIAEVAGTEAAWAISQAYGGRTIYIPREATSSHWLTELVGIEAATKICKHYRAGNAGLQLLIPLAKNHAAKQRLIKALEAGMSATQAASVAGMHERTAFRTRKKLAEEDDRQWKLFD